MTHKNFPKNHVFQPPLFPQIMVPNGFLDANRESHALWYYYLCARQALEAAVIDPIVFEGHKDPEENYRELFKNIARIYNVRPENMANCWIQIDFQCEASKLPKLPDEERYRFNRKVVVN